jgi:hypothetical protein
MIKRAILSVVLLCGAIFSLHAASISELVIDAGSGTAADLLVDSLGGVTCSGACGGLTFANTITPHGTLNVTGSIGQFTITTISGVGLAGLTPPTVLNLTQNEATAQHAGTLIVKYSETGYSSLSNTFNLSAQSNPDHQINGSTVLGQALIDPANALLAGSAFDSFDLTGVDSYVNSTPNAIAAGSLTAITELEFSGRGHIQSTFTLANLGVGVHQQTPEPGTWGTMAAAALLIVGLRKRCTS